MDKISLGVGQNMPLAALDLLTCVAAARTAAFVGFDALAVDHSGAGGRFASFALARGHEQRMVEVPPQPVVAPLVKPAEDRRDRWKAGR